MNIWILRLFWIVTWLDFKWYDIHVMAPRLLILDQFFFQNLNTGQNSLACIMFTFWFMTWILDQSNNIWIWIMGKVLKCLLFRSPVVFRSLPNLNHSTPGHTKDLNDFFHNGKLNLNLNIHYLHSFCYKIIQCKLYK